MRMNRSQPWLDGTDAMMSQGSQAQKRIQISDSISMYKFHLYVHLKYKAGETEDALRSWHNSHPRKGVLTGRALWGAGGNPCAHYIGVGSV